MEIEWNLMERSTFLSIEIVFGLQKYACLLGEDLQGFFFLIRWCTGYLHLPVINSREKRKGEGGREGKGVLRDKT